MKISAQEEYGMRCLLRLGKAGPGASLSIAEISKYEGLSKEYVAKLMRVLRRGGFVKSERGQAGGYTLSRPASQIMIGEVLTVLGGRLFEPSFCREHVGVEQSCSHSVDCSIRSLWRTLQVGVDQVLARTSLADLLCSEQDSSTRLVPVLA